ncbi:MAG: BTAD domain-containing putative transcriptional regulator [Vicinamibacterales bacterium]
MLTLLGQFRAHVTGHPDRLRLPTQKAVALLGYLALRDEPRVSRDYLAGLLWSDVPLPQGRHSLRQELTHIRTAIGSDAGVYLYADRESVALHLHQIEVDAERLEELVARHTSESMRDACAIYRGDLLTGLHTREQHFDAWLEGARADSRRLAIIAHEYRVEELREQGDVLGAITVAQQLLAIDATHEAARRVIALHDADAAPYKDLATPVAASSRQDATRGALQAALSRTGRGGTGSSSPDGSKRRFKAE